MLHRPFTSPLWTTPPPGAHSVPGKTFHRTRPDHLLRTWIQGTLVLTRSARLRPVAAHFRSHRPLSPPHVHRTRLSRFQNPFGSSRIVTPSPDSRASPTPPASLHPCLCPYCVLRDDPGGPDGSTTTRRSSHHGPTRHDENPFRPNGGRTPSLRPVWRITPFSPSHPPSTYLLHSRRPRPVLSPPIPLRNANSPLPTIFHCSRFFLLKLSLFCRTFLPGNIPKRILCMDQDLVRGSDHL